MSTTNREIGARVKVARKCRDMTQAQVAAKMGISQPRFAQLELGRGQWTVEQLARAARVLGIDLAHLADHGDSVDQGDRAA